MKEKRGKRKQRTAVCSRWTKRFAFRNTYAILERWFELRPKWRWLVKKSTVNHQSHIIESKCSGEVSNFPNIFYYVMYTNIHIYLYMQIMFSPIPRSKKSDDEVIWNLNSMNVRHNINYVEAMGFTTKKYIPKKSRWYMKYKRMRIHKIYNR